MKHLKAVERRRVQSRHLNIRLALFCLSVEPLGLLPLELPRGALF